jgi:hypothetical protein
MILRRPIHRIRASRRRAFTNVELLVVAAVAFILLSIIFVTVGKLYELLKSWS